MIQLKDKVSKNNVSITRSYLPTDNSVYWEEADDYFQVLVSLLYECVNDNLTILCEDYKARIGNRKDYIDTIEHLRERTVIDNTVNDHGISLINFLLQSNTCIVNGRCNPLENSYTSVSHRGRAAVDYFIVSNENFRNITNFRVTQIADLLQYYGLVQLANGAVSDHAMLHLTFKETNINGKYYR